MSTKEYGCFFCSGKSPDFDGICNECGRKINISSQLIKIKIENYEVIEILGRGYYGWTLKVQDQYQPFAMKILPSHRLIRPSLEEKEAKALVECSPHRNIARFWRQLKTTIMLFERDIDILCLFFEFIGDARPLSKVIEDDKIKLTRGDIVGMLTGIASGLARMHRRGLWHDDLHDDNILIRTVELDENLDEHYEAKLIDFGSVKPLREFEPESEGHSDYAYMAKHIFNLTLRFEINKKNSLSPIDRSFSKRLRKLGHRLADKNVSRRNLDPAKVVQEIQNSLEECKIGHDFPSFIDMKKQSRLSFKEPLSNTNAITLEPQDITLLFRDALSWTLRLEKSEPVFVVGPRGCGKTMLLRYLSLSSQARPRKMENKAHDVALRLDKEKHIGFLVSLGELRTPFLRSAYKKIVNKDESLTEDFCREWINAHFVFEVIRSFIWLHNEALASISDDDMKTLCIAINNLLKMEKRKLIKTTNLDYILEELEHRIMELSNISDFEKYNPSNLCSVDILYYLALAIRATSWAKSKEVWFHLDDYSMTVIPAIAQRAYNPVIFRLASEVKIKISSEGEGPRLDDPLGRKYKEGREFSKVNLGDVYFQASEEDGKEFFKQILDARFKETERGSLKELCEMLGEHPEEKGFGKYICSLNKPGLARFYGFGLLCRLCSGDVSFVIELMHSIANGRWGNAKVKPKLTETIQDNITKRFAHRQLADLRATANYGPKIYEFAERMGHLLKNYLLKSPNEPDERLRIEIEGTEKLCPDAQIMHDELLRHSVLIPGGFGKSRKGLPTRKLFFRRLFAPCFPFSPSRKGCVALTVKKYEEWLLDPSCICKITEEERAPLFSGKLNEI